MNNQQKARNKYNRNKMKSIAFRLHKESDAELIEIYESIPDKMEFLRNALREYERTKGHDDKNQG